MLRIPRIPKSVKSVKSLSLMQHININIFTLKKLFYWQRYSILQ